MIDKSLKTNHEIILGKKKNNYKFEMRKSLLAGNYASTFYFFCSDACQNIQWVVKTTAAT
jgi:hypothetical protein